VFCDNSEHVFYIPALDGYTPPSAYWPGISKEHNRDDISIEWIGNSWKITAKTKPGNRVVVMFSSRS